MRSDADLNASQNSIISRACVCVCMLSFHSTSIWIDLSIAHFCAIPVNEDELNENWVLKSNPFMFRTYKHTEYWERDAILSEQFHYEANLSSIRWHLFLALSYTIQFICLRFVKILVTALIELYSICSVYYTLYSWSEFCF